MIEQLFTPKEWFDVWNCKASLSQEQLALITKRLEPYFDAMKQVEWNSEMEARVKTVMAMTTLSMIEEIFERRGVV